MPELRFVLLLDARWRVPVRGIGKSMVSRFGAASLVLLIMRIMRQRCSFGRQVVVRDQRGVPKIRNYGRKEAPSAGC